MKNLKVWCVIFCMLEMAKIINAQNACISNTANVYNFVINNVKYELIKEAKSWKDAVACAVSRGGRVVEIDTEAKLKSIMDNLGNAAIKLHLTRAKDGENGAYLWIGGKDAGEEGEWLWDGDNAGGSFLFWSGNANGSAQNNAYTNWGKTQPDDLNNQDALGLALEDWGNGNGLKGQWNDLSGLNNALYFIIEYSKVPIGISENHIDIDIVRNNNFFNIMLPLGQQFECSIVNSTGQQVSFSKNQPQISLATLSKGFYILTVQSEKGMTAIKFIKE